MELGIAGKVAVITGAGGGIGRAIAKSLAAEGVRVIAVSREMSELESLRQELGGDAQKHHMIAEDLSQEGVGQRVFAAAEAQVGPVDILINNVGGTLNINDPFCSLADWRQVWRLNMEVAVEMSNQAIPHMQQQQWGRIVNISSISGVENHGPAPYCAAKAALIAYTRSMGRLLSPQGVIMTAVLPGAVFTEGGYWDTARRERPEHVEKYLQERMASHRFGTVEEISGVVAFLCSHHASFCVGSIVPVDGGQGRTFFQV